VRWAINDTTLDRTRWDEKEVVTTKKDLDHMAKYYQDSTQAIVFLKSEFREAYTQFTSERHLFTACVANFQEDTLMDMETYKYVERWYEKEY